MVIIIIIVVVVVVVVVVIIVLIIQSSQLKLNRCGVRGSPPPVNKRFASGRAWAGYGMAAY